MFSLNFKAPIFVISRQNCWKFSKFLVVSSRHIQNDSSAALLDDRIDSDVIHLTSTFNRQTKTIKNAIYPKLAFNSGSNLNVYCCGPTVYAHSHLGHAISYIRCDIINRTLKYLCNFNVHFAMNITDIDDKLIVKSKELDRDISSVANEFYNSFVEDLNSLNVSSPDCFLKVTENVDVISDYIKRIYDKGFAYVSDATGDVNFDYDKFIKEYSIHNEGNYGSNLRTDKSFGKRSPKDFALWKRSKPDEPTWNLNLNQNQQISGRPGTLMFIKKIINI